jgi:hypothetical protein
MNSWACDYGIISQLSQLEHQISLNESNLHDQWKWLKQQISERKVWRTDQKHTDIARRKVCKWTIFCEISKKREFVNEGTYQTHTHDY